MDWQSLLELMHEGNTTQTRFYGEVGHEEDLGRVMVAMANTKGGRIFIGMDLINYHLKGTNVDRKWIDDLCHRYCSPPLEFHAHMIHRNEKIVLAVTVSEGIQKPYTFQNVCYVMDPEGQPQQALLDKSSIASVRHVDHKVLDDSVADIDAQEQHVVMMSDVRMETVDNTSVKSDRSSAVVKDADQLTKRQKRVLQYLKDHQTIKNSEYRKKFSVSHKTAHLELVDLVAKGLLRVKGSGRGTCYEGINP